MSDASLDASRKIYEARMCLTEFFGGEDADRLVFTANSTESLNIAIHGLLEPGENVITTQLEHNSVLRRLFARCVWLCESQLSVCFYKVGHFVIPLKDSHLRK